MRHLQIYTAIRAIVRSGSIRKASEILAISPSALNRQVLALEEELGISLFDRIPGGVRLSTAGEIYYRQFLDHLGEIERAAATVADLQGLRIGHVRIAVAPELATAFLPQEVTRFRTAYPGVRFTMMPASPHEFEELLITREADLALAIRPETAFGVETIAAAEVPICAVIHRAPQLGSAALTLDDLLNYDVVLPTRRLGFGRDIDLALKRKRLDLRPAIETDTLLGAMPGSDRQIVQLWPAVDIPREMQTSDRVEISTFRARSAPSSTVILAQQSDRSLPVGCLKFAQQLESRLAEVAP